MKNNQGSVAFRFVSPTPTVEVNGVSRKSIWSSRTREALLDGVRQWYHFSLLRQVLLERCSALRRISWSQCRRTVLEFSEVRQSLPQAPCSGSRNAMQFCSAGIERLSVDQPYLTLGDFRLFAAGFFLAEKWFLHRDSEGHNEQRDSSVGAPEAQQVYAAPSSSATDQT
jgi:hypothetical protein